MTVEEMQAQLKKMKDDIAHMEAKVSECEHMISVIKTQNDAKFERAKKLEGYFMISFADGKARADMSCECYDELDNSRYDNNNYFKTNERAQEVADKINFLLKLERLRDTFCPDFVPDWNSDEVKFTIYYNHERVKPRYKVQPYCYIRHPTTVYFPTEEIAQKVCDILNKERENE